ncbi:DUF2784 domain-containing protein [Mycobacterium kyorinense]|uniref:DUF2784 domain-containing protein n=1 Tax=Mycobacterium kyorinense TaxID=487514 RepID=UPI000AA16902|nr:DUF2784 domain-containing protein [Mycobacterium kyorinense]
MAAIVATHFAYLIYLPSGGFLALRWPRTVVLHVPAVLWGVGVVAFGFPCPLTWLEQRARGRAGLGPLPASGFVDRYVEGVFYPVGTTDVAQTVAFAVAGISWVVLIAKRGRKRKQRRRSHGHPAHTAAHAGRTEE